MPQIARVQQIVWYLKERGCHKERWYLNEHRYCKERRCLKERGYLKERGCLIERGCSKERGYLKELLQVAVTATTWSVLAASPGSTGIKRKGCKSARTSRKKKGVGVSLLACRQYGRRTSAKEDAIRIGVVSIRITHS